MNVIDRQCDARAFGSVKSRRQRIEGVGRVLIQLGWPGARVHAGWDIHSSPSVITLSTYSYVRPRGHAHRRTSGTRPRAILRRDISLHFLAAPAIDAKSVHAFIGQNVPPTRFTRGCRRSGG
jgi:hypothetical protein